MPPGHTAHEVDGDIHRHQVCQHTTPKHHNISALFKARGQCPVDIQYFSCTIVEGIKEGEYDPLCTTPNVEKY